MKSDYQEIELELSNLINSLGGVFSLNELIEIKDFIDYGEYGLALETAIDVVIEEKKLISSESFNIMIKLSHLMTMNKDVISSRLKDYVI
ncbi:MafI family immunity protein [Pectobacterium parmentieri]|uniref:MafI family immunity protein n=1 Tax=Pectobacterium parmentieri TaxID=1905730 RepID=UPI0018E197F9|nr:MafI family immunity protein [Pectobacterium parmentieri]QQA75769.1 MafI family immunity protein [Pectobacterium parmentieri]